jgi:hypothetical protein
MSCGRFGKITYAIISRSDAKLISEIFLLDKLTARMQDSKTIWRVWILKKHGISMKDFSNNKEGVLKVH